jgi:glycosyltransferase involved in cell wall biosynthesis
LRKGVNYLIEAMSILKDKHPEYRLILIGEGSERGSFEKLVANLELESFVEFLGVQSQQQVGKFLRESRLFVLPSIEEGQGVVLLEAMASGTPCVGSRVGGIPDVIKPGVGNLVEARDVVGLAGAIESYIEDETLWLEASKKARERVENEYNWNSLSEKIISVYQRVLYKEN